MGRHLYEMVKIGSWYRVNLENVLCSKRMGTAAATYLCNCRKRMKWSFPWLVKKKYFLSETSWSQQRTIFANSSFSQVTRRVIFTQWSKKRSRYGLFFFFESYKHEKGKWPTFLCFEAFRNLFQIGTNEAAAKFGLN